MAAKRMALRLTLALAMALAAALALAPRAQGAVCVWTGAVNNDWHTAGNWNCGSVPGALDSAVIGDAGANPDPVLNGSTSVFQVDINTGGILITTSGVTLTAAFLNLNGYVTGPGILSVTNTWTWGAASAQPADGLLDGGGQIVIQSGARGRIHHQAEQLRLSNFTLVNHGTVEPYEDFMYVVMTNNAVVHNYGIFALRAGFYDYSQNGIFYNHSGASLQVLSTSYIDSALINDGLVNIQSGDLSICRGGTQTGQFTSANGAMVLFGGCYEVFSPTSFTFTTTSVITVSRVHFTGMPTTSYVFSGTYGPMGNTSETTIGVPTTFTADAVVNSFGSALNIYHLFTLNATAPSNLYDLVVSGSSARFTYGGTINIAHEMICRYGATLDGGGLLRVQTDGVLRFNGSYDTTCTLDGKQVVNKGEGYWSGTGDIVGLNGAVLTNEGTLTFGGDTMSGSLSFTNSGSLIKNSINTTTIAVPFTNTGSIRVNAGSLVFTDELIFPNGSNNQIDGTLHVLHLINAGTLRVNGIVEGDLTNNGQLYLKGTVTGDLVNNSSMDPGGSIGLAVVQGSFTQTASGGMGIELTPPGGDLPAAPVPGVDFDQLQVSGSITLAGHLQLIAGGGLDGLPAFSELPILTSGVGVSGAFDTLGTSDFPDGYPWRLRVGEEWVFFDVGGWVFLPAVAK